MHRRRFIAGLGGAALVGAAGCLSGPADDGTDSPTETASPPPNETPTPTDSPTPGTPVLAGTSFEVLDNRLGERLNEATVAASEDAVEVTGTVWGANGCYTARLANATVEDDRLVVTVESYEETGDGTPACTQAIVVVDYSLSATFEGWLPGIVEVRHDTPDGETVVAEVSL